MGAAGRSSHFAGHLQDGYALQVPGLGGSLQALSSCFPLRAAKGGREEMCCNEFEQGDIQQRANALLNVSPQTYAPIGRGHPFICLHWQATQRGIFEGRRVALPEPGLNPSPRLRR